MSRHRAGGPITATGISDSTARGLRTAYQAAVGLIGMVPALITIFALLPTNTPGYAQIGAIVANVVVWTGIASKVINALEDRGVIPAPWKQTTSEPVVVESEVQDGQGPAQQEPAEEGDVRVHGGAA